MIKANATIIVGGKTFRAGQTVTGLSKIDKEWMKKAGHIIETSNKNESRNIESMENELIEGTESEF